MIIFVLPPWLYNHEIVLAFSRNRPGPNIWTPATSLVYQHVQHVIISIVPARCECVCVYTLVFWSDRFDRIKSKTWQSGDEHLILTDTKHFPWLSWEMDVCVLTTLCNISVFILPNLDNWVTRMLPLSNFNHRHMAHFLFCCFVPTLLLG